GKGRTISMRPTWSVSIPGQLELHRKAWQKEKKKNERKEGMKKERKEGRKKSLLLLIPNLG
ncbi:hypothetical protein ACQP3C_30935, partial [Escherichia coli]